MKCYCHTCRPIDYRDPESVYMRLCPNCGNKRCPKATDHRNECSGSNDAGQIGSIYGEKCKHTVVIREEHLTGEGAMEYVEWYDCYCTACGEKWTEN